MNKKQLIDALSAKLEQQNIRYPKWELTSIIEPALEVIMETLCRNEAFPFRNRKEKRLFY
ncbi:hypothetical protein [Phocaeicola sp.]